MNTLAALAPRDLLTVHSAEHRAVAATSAADAARLATLRAAELKRVAELQASVASGVRAVARGLRLSARSASTRLAERSALALNRSSPSSPDPCCA